MVEAIGAELCYKQMFLETEALFSFRDLCLHGCDKLNRVGPAASTHLGGTVCGSGTALFAARLVVSESRWRSGQREPEARRPAPKRQPSPEEPGNQISDPPGAGGAALEANRIEGSKESAVSLRADRRQVSPPASEVEAKADQVGEESRSDDLGGVGASVDYAFFVGAFW
jgi:hypothetical protein